jgi:hypothetical protein
VAGQHFRRLAVERSPSAWIQIVAPWLVVFGSAVLSGWLVSQLFRAHRAAAVLSLAAAIVVAGAILLSAADLGPLALGSVLLLDASQPLAADH